MEYCTIKEVAETVGVHSNTVRNWIDSGDLKAYKLGKVIRIRKEDLEAFAKEIDGREDKKEGE